MNASRSSPPETKPPASTAPNDPSANYAYDGTFYRYIQDGAVRSARVIAPLVVDRLGTSSLLDVGCGAGAWLSEYRKLGVQPCLGVDGDYVKAADLLVPQETFIARDISLPFDLMERFALVQCLEVGEHIETAASGTLVANLVRHGDCILFSAAIPGQGGENHINERPYEFWRALFAEHGYMPYDFLRPLLRRAKEVEIWYRHNVMLYVAASRHGTLPVEVSQSRVPDNEPIANVCSPLYRMRTAILAGLPVSWLSHLAILKHRSILLSRMVRGQR
ncbi:hypothetical protein ACPOL_5318 [Acidisarcina polymorpha]|uniref:Methyltransferase domain-containing protein n=2 Tax=Acidisarcina polymorpha TaxID=2211140 RepID=A0A2Z5G647_9BACT|nr:hypothetical protein ACPOL_5318 [Acidisarcina polymorpha]